MDTVQRELERRVFYLNALNELGKELGPLQNLEAICNTALSVTMGTVGAMRGVVFLGDLETEQMQVCALRGIGAGETPNASVDALKEIEDAQTVIQMENELGSLLKEIGMITWTPMQVDTRLVGGLGFGPKMSGEGFTDEDQSLLSTIADSTAMALRNAMHYTDLQKAYEQLEYENQTLRGQLEPIPEMVSRSPRMQAILDLAGRVADTPSTVLLTGESGTGKEVLARSMHKMSGRDGAFVAVHCAALPTTLLESELFGHEKGAFTNAIERREGRFEIADGGTLFLDEVGEIAPEVQVKLLRVLQEQQFERVGSSETLSVDVRVIAATNRDLETAVQSGTFREDLFYRLNVVPITLMPLRERTEDIPVLVDHFLEQSCQKSGRDLKRISKDTMAFLMAHPWPGNVRELQNLIERLVVISIDDTITPDDLPDDMGKSEKKNLDDPLQDDALISLEEVEKQYVEKALMQCNWNQSEAARILGISRTKLRDRIKRFNIRGTWRVGAPGRKS